jgi:hypothetical protein
VYWWPVFIVGTFLVVIALLAIYTPYDLYPEDEQDNRPPGTNRGQHTQIGRLQAFMLAGFRQRILRSILLAGTGF